MRSCLEEYRDCDVDEIAEKYKVKFSILDVP